MKRLVLIGGSVEEGAALGFGNCFDFEGDEMIFQTQNGCVTQQHKKMKYAFTKEEALKIRDFFDEAIKELDG